MDNLNTLAVFFSFEYLVNFPLFFWCPFKIEFYHFCNQLFVRAVGFLRFFYNLFVILDWCCGFHFNDFVGFVLVKLLYQYLQIKINHRNAMELSGDHFTLIFLLVQQLLALIVPLLTFQELLL